MTDRSGGDMPASKPANRPAGMAGAHRFDKSRILLELADITDGAGPEGHLRQPVDHRNATR
jgi:hypothetical protein